MSDSTDSWEMSVVKIEIDVAEEPPVSWRSHKSEQGQGTCLFSHIKLLMDYFQDLKILMKWDCSVFDVPTR